LKLAWYLPICFRLWGKQVSFYIKSIKISISSDKSPLCQQPGTWPEVELIISIYACRFISKQ